MGIQRGTENEYFLISILLLAAFALSATPAPRLDSWKILGPGGGGAQFIPTISPHDPKTVLVGCDMTGSYISHDGGISWRMFNLRSPSRFFLFDPIEPRTIYAATSALWRSADTGKTWNLVFPTPESVTGVAMIDDHAGVRIQTRDRALSPSALAVDPSDSKTLYLAAGDRSTTSLMVSSNWGKSWSKAADLPGRARQIFVDPKSPVRDRTLYVVGNNSVSVREGGAWRRFPAPEGVSAFGDISGGFSKDGRLLLYAVTQNSVYISEDAGATWRTTSLSLLSWGTLAPRYEAIACSSGRPEVAYLSYRNLRKLTGTYFGVAKTVDAGKTWKLVRTEARTIAANVKEAYLGRRFGPGWASNPINIGVAPADPDICYTTDYGRTMRTTDGGETWHAAYSKETPGGAYATTGIDVTTCYGVHFDPHDSNRVFISYTDIGLFRSEDGGTSWLSSTAGVPGPWVNTTYWIEFDPDVKGRLWGVMSGIHDLPRPKMWARQSPERYNGGVGISDDGGRNWRVASNDLPPTAATHILLDPASPPAARVLYVTGLGRGVFKSADGGATWALKNRGIEGNTPFAWRIARDRDGALYLVVARRTEDGSYGNPGDGALYRSANGAENWEKLTLPEGVNGPNGIAVDPRNPNRLYLAAWRRAIPAEDGFGGIYLSNDRGRSWRRVLAKDQFVYDVTIDPRDPRILYASGFQSSAWRSADRGETWRRIKGYNFKWGHRVIPDPKNPAMIYITTFGGSAWYGPAAGDPKAPEDIATPQLQPVH